MVARSEGRFEPFTDLTPKALLTSRISQRFRIERVQPFGVLDEPFTDCQRTAEETDDDAGRFRIESREFMTGLGGKLQHELTRSLRVSASFERFFPGTSGEYRFWHNFRG